MRPQNLKAVLLPGLFCNQIIVPQVAAVAIFFITTSCFMHSCMGSTYQQLPMPWARPYIPPRPEPQAAPHEASLRIAAKSDDLVSGGRMFVNATVANHGQKLVLVPEMGPQWYAFPGTWCWGPTNRHKTPMLRFVRDGYRRLFRGPAVRIRISPGRSAAVADIDYSHIFDLSVPGRYEAQLSGMGMISNIVRFRVLLPKSMPEGPAVVSFASKNPDQAAWGSPHDGVEVAAYVKNDPGVADPVARVRVLFRCAGKHAATISLTGNPHIDFARRVLVGPCQTGFKAIDGRPVPPTTYGKLLANRNRKHLPTAKTYTLKPGVVYTYWRLLVLNREFDLSVYGPYRFSAQLHGTEMKTAPIIIYVGVQSRFYAHVNIPK